MINELKYLQTLREELRLHKDILIKKNVEFQIANEGLLYKIESLGITTTECENEIRDAAIVLFKKNGEKKLEGGVGIRVMKLLEYDDEKAFSWANEHSLALALDKRAFEKIAKADDIDFVSITDFISATIPRELNVMEEKK